MLIESAGLFGIVGDRSAAESTVLALHSLQHRGSQETGVAVSNGHQLYASVGTGLVLHNFKEDFATDFKATSAVGRVYGSIPYQRSLEPQSVNIRVSREEDLGLVTSKSGDLVNLFAEAMKTALIGGSKLKAAIEQAVDQADFSFMAIWQHQLAVYRNPQEYTPLCMGRLGSIIAFSTESCALETLGIYFTRELEAGELIIAVPGATESFALRPGRRVINVAEYLSGAHPASMIEGRNVGAVRHRLGENLARECLFKAQRVIPVPEGAFSAADGFSHESGIPIAQGLIRNRYADQAPIHHNTKALEGIHFLLNPIRSSLVGQDIIVVDNTLYTGNTARKIIAECRRTGSGRIFMAIAAPPMSLPDSSDSKTQTPQDPMATRMKLEEMRVAIGADGLYFLSPAGTKQAIGLPEEAISMDHCIV